MTAALTPTDRLRALLAAEFPADTPQFDTALLLLSTATGQEEVRLYTQVTGGQPGHETAVYRSEAPHAPFALDLIAALHAHRLTNWRPMRDAYMPGVIHLGTRRATGQIGWALDLRRLREDSE
ncbi:hypothetical protein [Streptomyces sp. IBSBF 2950]|uniref:hypothetical protein n=1 Tax=Streptomyces sp. IBSBF 2950 TaxID=2903528 RepID=UPI002FDBEA2A